MLPDRCCTNVTAPHHGCIPKVGGPSLSWTMKDETRLQGFSLVQLLRSHPPPAAAARTPPHRLHFLKGALGGLFVLVYGFLTFATGDESGHMSLPSGTNC